MIILVLQDRDKKEREEVVQTLQEQLEIEGQLIGLYDEYERDSDNKAMKRVMQMFRLDSQRHINIIQAAIEIIEGEDVFIEDRAPLKETFKKHIELEAEALKRANSVLRRQWVDETPGLKNLIEMWRDDEKRHHAALKRITTKPFIRMAGNDMITLFRGEDFLEERYKKAKEFKAKQAQKQV